MSPGDPHVGSPAVEGIAIGRASKWASAPPPRQVSGTPEEEHGRLSRALQRATRGVEELVKQLPPAEAELFLPEILILGELGPLLLAKVEAGALAEDAVNEGTSQLSTDLLLDVRARLLDSLGHDQRSVEALLEGRDGDRVLVTASLTVSVVAVLPDRVVGIVAASDGIPRGPGDHTSHAVILAQGRSIPVAFLPSEVVRSIADDDSVVVDTTGEVANVWIAPEPSVVAEARKRLAERLVGLACEEAETAAPLGHLGLEMHVNMGSIDERLPACADGIGLLRTELAFSAHAWAPSELEQFAALRAIAATASNVPVVVRLFDAGGDKPLSWLAPPEGSPLLRGIALLRAHPEILATQLRAILRVAEHVQVRILLPMVTSPADVEHVRALSQGKLAVGAMIETPEAVDRVEDLAVAADFISIGTNDLSAGVSGQDRSEAESFDVRMLRMIERVVDVAHARSRKVSVCGEMASHRLGARILVGLKVDAISVAPFRFAAVKRSLRDATLDDCRRMAREAMGS